MIHKRNATLMALALTLAIAIVFLIHPRIYHGALGVAYLPSLVLAVIIGHFTGSGHSPPNSIGWISFAVYTIFYIFLFLFIYVIVLEFYLLRGALHHLDDAKKELDPEKPDSQKALENIGQAIAEVEGRRRKHFLLKPIDSIDLKEAPFALAAHAITQVRQPRPVIKLLKKLESRLAAGTSPLQASVKLSDLRNDARKLISNNLTGQ
jgi:hypothetical protein